MRAISPRRTLFAVAAALSLGAAADANAALFRAYLSSTGNDAGGCSLGAPCRLLPAALAAVNAGGEIWILDSANYNTGTVLIDKSVAISANPGVRAGFVGNNGDAIVVNGPGVSVTFRNVQFENLAGSGNVGIRFLQGNLLTVRDSTFTGMPFAGILMNAASTSRAQVMNSTFTSNNNGITVTGGRATLVDNNFIYNSLAIMALGNGGASFNPPNGTTVVRVSGGQYLDNNTVFHMESPGVRQGGTCNGSNIFLRGTGSGSTLHIVGNATYLEVTGTADNNPGCVGPPATYTIDGYQSPIL